MGIGRRLALRTIAEFRVRDYHWMYGQFRSAETRLERFYQELGFDLVEPDSDMTELPLGIWPAEPGYRWFYETL